MEQNRNKQDDPRYRIANREAWIGIGIVVVNFLLWFGFAYGLGAEPVEDYQYIWGLPAWFFYSCIAVTGFIFVVVIFAVRYFFIEVPLDEEGDE
ncbi:YhdT family protein [Bacillus sp. SB49]|uniref:YhdT family protein n=1 Tax=Bacillus sp. SB49 TaxID=1071080 RepID=UPI000413CF74|nr:YhdT family protein [Bacillus sp. SB49]QHT47047.1 YhdT family protein [Bacillus sp. SB49]